MSSKQQKMSDTKEFSSAFIIPHYVGGYQQQKHSEVKKLIIENNILKPANKISSPILEILESHVQSSLEGNNIWIKMGTETGITNITSSTAVRIQFAYRCPFPNEKASEDFHCWIRMSALGANFKYTSLIPTKYRIPSFMKYQASRTRIGLR